MLLRGSGLTLNTTEGARWEMEIDAAGGSDYWSGGAEEEGMAVAVVAATSTGGRWWPEPTGTSSSQTYLPRPGRRQIRSDKGDVCGFLQESPTRIPIQEIVCNYSEPFPAYTSCQ